MLFITCSIDTTLEYYSDRQVCSTASVVHYEMALNNTVDSNMKWR